MPVWPPGSSVVVSVGHVVLVSVDGRVELVPYTSIAAENRPMVLGKVEGELDERTG